MYKKSVQGWLKHLDFMILDVVCLWISFTLAFNMRHGSLDVLANSLYRDMMWSLALMDIVVIFFFDSLKNVLKRGFYQEFVMTVKQTCLITLCSVFYLFTFKEAENYSRLVLGYTAALYLLLSYVLRCLWKNCLRKYFGGAEKRSLLIVTVSDIVDTVIDNIKNKNYGDYFVTGVCILDKKAKGRVIDGVTVVADEDDLVEYVCREWVDEVFINIPESEPYPAELLDKFIEMGVVVHMKLAKSQNLLGKKQFVEHLGTYTVLTTSINSVSRRQIILKRMMDIAGGLAGCIITGILCIFVGPAIYIQSPGPIFFKQTRVGKNGKMFQMYKFRSMYMDAEERKAELMKENRVQDGMMFKLDFDPRIIGSKKLPDGTIKKGVGNFIRDWSLDEFPQFLNVLKGAKGMVGTALVNNLKNIRDNKNRTRPNISVEDIYEYDLDSTPEELDQYCQKADFVFNLAGVNRPENPEDFMKGNFGFASDLLNTLKKYNNKATIMLSSSIQATLAGRFGNSEYGRSKKAGEELFFDYANETGAKVAVYRFPNLMGHSRPKYNSAVSTFCWAVANDEEFTVNDSSTELELLYIDDLVEGMFDLIEGKEKHCEFDGVETVIKEDGKYCCVPVTHKVTLGEIVDLLQQFKEQPTTLMMPKMPEGSFAKKLYSLYLTYLPTEKFKYALKMNVDNRGSFTELVHTQDCGQVSINISRPGITKGQHWHNSKWELFIVVAGHGLIQERNINTGEKVEFEVSGDKIEAIHMIPGWTHNIINLSETENLVTVMTCNEIFNPERPDTFFEEV